MSVVDLGSNAVTLISPHTHKAIVTVKTIEGKRELLRGHLEHRAWLITHDYSADGAGRLYVALNTPDGVSVREIADAEAAARSLGVAIPVITMSLRQALSAGAE